MADGADLVIDLAALNRAGDRMVRRHLTAGTAAVGSSTRRLEKKLEAATQAAAGGRLWRAWQSSVYPRSGPARDPAGTIWLKGGSRTRGAIRFWTEPGAIRGREGQYLAVPLPAAGPRGRGSDLSPLEWESAHNIELEFVPRPGKAPLLVAQQGTLSRGGTVRTRSQKQAVRDIGRASRISVPIFVLLPLVKFRNAFAIAPMIRASELELAADYLAAIGASNREG